MCRCVLFCQAALIQASWPPSPQTIWTHAVKRSTHFPSTLRTMTGISRQTPSSRRGICPMSIVCLRSMRQPTPISSVMRILSSRRSLPQSMQRICPAWPMWIRRFCISAASSAAKTRWLLPVSVLMKSLADIRGFTAKSCLKDMASHGHLMSFRALPFCAMMWLWSLIYQVIRHFDMKSPGQKPLFFTVRPVRTKAVA